MKTFMTLTLLLSSIVAHATPMSSLPEKNPSPYALENHIELNDMRFTNRAQCAKDSLTPTTSAFVLLNNVDVAKAVYRLAKFKGENTTELTKLGINVYRYSVVQLMELIHNKLLNRELPLLPSDSTELHVPHKYKKLMKECRSDEYCDELDEYISKIWNVSSQDKSAAWKVVQLYKVDNYHSKMSYIVRKDVADKDEPVTLNCHYLKKFSPLQAQLYGTKPDAAAFTAIAEAAKNKEEYLASCYDFDAQTNLQVGAFQLELKNLKTKKWNKKGFDYWHSFKLYFSWAFRNAPEMKSMAMPFSNVFKSVAVEDSVMISPNGCKSITRPSCDNDYVAQNAIREFAKKDFKKRALSTDVLSSLPEGPENDMLEDPFTKVNTDILDLGKFRGADKWLNNFRENMAGTRSIMKSKLISAVSFMNILMTKLSAEDIAKKLGEQFNSVAENEELKNELYYLCSEVYFANHKEFSFIRGKLDILKETTLVDGIANQISKEKTETLFSYYKVIADQIATSCNMMKQKEIWDDSFTLDRTGYAKWYHHKVLNNKYKSSYDNKIKTYLESNEPLLSFAKYETSGELTDVVCAHASDCARKAIKSIVDLYAVTQYANTFWSLNQQIKSPNMFNPYAERTACQVYDPWFKKKSIMFNLFMDMSQAALSVVTPGIIYGRADLKPGKVTSFRQLVKDGKIEYDVQADKQKISYGLVAEFGPLLGVPCTVSVLNSANNPYDVFKFSGISVGACTSKEEYNLNVNTASDMNQSKDAEYSSCMSCQLNFESVATTVTHVSKKVGPTFFLIRGLIRLYKGLKDPHNIPRSWEANPQYVLEAYNTYGEIPKKCVRSLRKGKRCAVDACMNRAAKNIDDKLIGDITSMRYQKNKIVANISTCSEPLVMKYNKWNQDSSNTHSSQNRCSVSKLKVPSACSHAKK